MKDLAKSTFIFDLIEEFEIFSSAGASNEFTDEAFHLFCKKYKDLSEQRDVSLYRYLNSTPNLFRTHLPHSKWVFAVAFNVVWYYDELIINDPVLHIINSKRDSLELKKKFLQDLLSLLKNYKESIEAGYFLFSGDNITPNKTGQFDEESNSIVNIPQVLEAYNQISMMGKKQSPINENIEDNLTQLEIWYDGLWGEVRKMGMYIPKHIFVEKKLTNGLNYDFLRPYDRLTKEELINFDKYEMLESLKDEYSKDISVVLEAITNAQRLNSPVLFYRDADCIAARSYASLKGKGQTNLFTDTSVYDCVVPYVEGIPADRLADVRNKLPEAFKDFRGFLFELVMKTMKSTDNPAEFKFKVDSEINTLMRKLKTEMSNAQRKWNLHGIATPLIIMTGSLSLLSSGIDFSKLLLTFLGSGGGIVKGLTTWSDVKADKNNAALNPVYFLWKAQQQ